MSFLLCHDCYTWVEPLDNRCPECLLVMDLSAEDPPVHLLREVMGNLTGRLGEVRIPRKLLPEWGTLYATTEGLFFVPHEMDQALRRDDGQFTGTSLMWSLGSLIWSPLFFLSPFVRGSHVPDRPVRVLRPRYLSETESGELPDLLMDNPGAFFLPRRQIQAMMRKRGRWIIERSQGGVLPISPVAPARFFHDNLTTLLESPAWQTVEK